MRISFHALNRGRIVGDSLYKFFEIGIVMSYGCDLWFEIVLFNREINMNIFWLNKKMKAYKTYKRKNKKSYE